MRRLRAPRSGDRAVFFGKTGSGKSTLARHFLSTIPNAILVDTKLVEDWSDLAVVVNGDEIYDIIKKGRVGRFAWRVSQSFLLDIEEQDRFFRDCLRHRNRTIYIDECADVGTGNRFAPGLKLLAVQGRAANCGLWVSTQRPHQVPLFTISEANAMFTFEMGLKRDRERIEQVFERKLNFERLANTHAFFAKYRGTFEGPIQLQLP